MSKGSTTFTLRALPRSVCSASTWRKMESRGASANTSSSSETAPSKMSTGSLVVLWERWEIDCGSRKRLVLSLLLLRGVRAEADAVTRRGRRGELSSLPSLSSPEVEDNVLPLDSLPLDSRAPKMKLGQAEGRRISAGLRSPSEPLSMGSDRPNNFLSFSSQYCLRRWRIRTTTPTTTTSATTAPTIEETKMTQLLPHMALPFPEFGEGDITPSTVIESVAFVKKK